MSVWQHPKHGVYYIREAVPVDIQSRAGTKTYKRSLGTKLLTEARRLYPDALTVFQAWIEGHRRGPVQLTSRDVEALVGKWYRSRLEAFSRDPRPLSDLPEFFKWSLGLTARHRVLSALMIRPTASDLRAAHVGSEVDALLTSEGLSVDDASRARLCERLQFRVPDLLGRMGLRFAGDYSADPVLSQFPEWSASAPAIAQPSVPITTTDRDTLTFTDLFDRWEKVVVRSPKTVREYRGYLDAFQTFIGHDTPAQVDTLDVERWRNSLKARGLRTATVQKKYLAALSTIYSASQGTGRGRLPSNPVDGAWFHGREFEDSDTRTPYTPDELVSILTASRLETLPELRWYPWLLTYTGLRPREAAQLVAGDLRERDGITYLDVNKDQPHKRVKGKPGMRSASLREVPLHPALIAEGFPGFVSSFADPSALLFPRIAPRPTGKDTQGRPVTSMRAWFRKVSGRHDTGLGPVHSLRHSFEDALRLAAAGSDELRYAIQGREDRSSARGYGLGPTLQQKQEAINRIPAHLGIASGPQRLQVGKEKHRSSVPSRK